MDAAIKGGRDKIPSHFLGWRRLLEKQAHSIAKVVSIEFIENKNSFSKQNWKELYKLSEDTFVEESDSLKKTGAGAGLTDND